MGRKMVYQTSFARNSREVQARRDFLLYTTSTIGTVGVAMALWPFIHSMNPAADVLALSSSEVDLSAIALGQAVTLTWRGRPIFVRHRMPEEIEIARSIEITTLPDPQKDEDRVQKPEWLILVGVCTHLGCVPLGQKPTDPRGDYGGWFCPCHGSHYDISGRIRKGPAPFNLAIPPYVFTTDETIRIG